MSWSRTAGEWFVLFITLILLQPCPVGSSLGKESASTMFVSNIVHQSFRHLKNRYRPWSPRQSNRYAPICMSEKILIVGGTGRIGTAVASHLLKRSPDRKAEIILAGRDRSKGAAAVEEVMRSIGEVERLHPRVVFEQLDWRDEAELTRLMQSGITSVVNTAGPFLGIRPSILQAAIKHGIPSYVDVADPTSYLVEALSLHEEAQAAGTCAVVAAGAFPGLSNLMAMEAVDQLGIGGGGERVEDVNFDYFTAGLGGSGEVNLLITNLGFGEEVEIFQQGVLNPVLRAGLDQKQVDFFFDEEDVSKRKIGTVNTWLWPFPEGRTVAEQVKIAGSSRVAMGTAPEIWNIMMNLLVLLVPRAWWKEERFSQALASFSKPLVAFTDLFVGETHGIRVEVRSTSGKTIVGIQAHDSFRTCVVRKAQEQDQTVALTIPEGSIMR
eukprot:520673-Hanusia_phi.AAC.1